MHLTEQIKSSLLHYDIVRWREKGNPEDYNLLAELLAEDCWKAKIEREMKYIVQSTFLDFCHPTIVPAIESLEPLALDIWNIRKYYKVEPL